MPARPFPRRPNLEQFRIQAKELLRAIREGDESAVSDLKQFHPDPIVPSEARLADAQLVLARTYCVPSWTRLVQTVELMDAVKRRDIETVKRLGALDKKMALQGLDVSLLESGEVEIASILYDLAGRPAMPHGILNHSTFKMNVGEARWLLDNGAEMRDASGRLLAPIDSILQSPLRDTTAKHNMLELYVERGFELPDTPTIALHRGRIDLLERLLESDPAILNRTFTHSEIFPSELGCGEPVDAVVGAPLEGTTLRHMAIEFNEMDIAKWLIAKGADVNAKSAVNVKGFGGYTPIFSAVVSAPNYWMNKGGGPFNANFAELVLEHGADVNIRASIQKRHHPTYGYGNVTQYRHVTPLTWGEAYEDKSFVNREALALIEAKGGQRAW
jgi:hypothetical protein